MFHLAEDCLHELKTILAASSRCGHASGDSAVDKCAGKINAEHVNANRFADDPADQLGPHLVAVDLTRQLGPSPTRSPTDGVADGVS